MSNIKVTVQDANNVLLEVTPVPIQQIAISRGVAGRGIDDVQAIEIDNALYLEFFFTDGTTEIVGPVGTIQYIGESPIVVDAATISLSTVPVTLGGTGQITANAGFNALAPSQTGNAGKYLTTDGSNTSWANNPLGTVTSVDMTVPTGLTVSGNPITTSGTLAVALQSGYSIPTTASQTNWDTAYSERQQWNGGATNLVAATGRTSLGLGTIATQDASAVAITGGSITGITDLAVADGGTGASTAAGAMVNLLPSYTGNANKRLSLDSTASGLEWVTDGGGTVTSVDVSGGTTGLSFTGGPITTSGTITLSGTLDVDNGGTGATTAAGARTNLNAADQALTLTAGTGLSGGGDLTANRSFSIANTGVTAASYGAASKTLTATVNAQGQLTALADTDIAISNTQISGLGTMSTQNANAVAITGGSITGITDLAVADGGTGASTAADARTNLGAAASATTISAGTGLSGGGDLTANRTLSIANTAVTAGSYGTASDTLTATVNAQGQLTALAATPIAISNTQISGLGTMSTQNSNAVTITGGSITGITDLAIADGGTGASNAADARSNLGLGTAAVLNAGVANGVATLDAGGTVPLSQIPASIQGGVSYQGAWNASTNTPTLTSSVGTKGHYYVVSVAGNTNLNGVTDWLVGDWAIYNGTAWEKIDNTDQVASVNGYTGVVVLTNTDVGAPPTSLTISAGTGLSGGGDLTTNRTLSIANTAVSAGSYGTASAVPSFTVNGQGQLTAASDVTIAISNAQVSGLGTMSTQNANSVSITGGSITGITDLAIADGGTGASNAADARANLGVTATGGDTTYLFRANNLSDLANAATARTNLGLGTAATQDSTAFATAAQGAKADTAIQTITSTDGSIVVTPAGTTINLAVSEASPASTLLTAVRNTTGATLTKGTVVYISGATGQIATVSKAIATGDATSAQTLGMITSDLANNSDGYVTVFGLLENIDTSSYTDGAQLYLSGTTAGAVTATKPSAPTHLVYVAVVEYAHPTQGKLLVKVQNGYELDEIHDVSIVSPTTGQTLVYNATTDLWVNNTVSLTAGVNGTLPIANGGTGQTTANTAFNALAPSQTGNSGKYLTTDGTNTSWAVNAGGDVVGPASSTNNGIALFDGTTGKLLKDSASTDGLIYGLTVGRGAGAVATNTAVGASALAANTTGSLNTVVGYFALDANTSGDNNSVFGYAAMGDNSTGSNNSAMGVSALASNTTGSNNTAVGRQALLFNTTAPNNTAVGYTACYSNTTGARNSAVGTGALYYSTGDENTALGYNAGRLISSGSYNIAIGAYSMDNSAGVTGSDNVTVGRVSLRSLTSGAYNTAVGNGALQANTTASNNTAVGYQAGYNNTTGNITALGYLAGYGQTTGTLNTFLGMEQGSFNTVIGVSNSGVGYRALLKISSGSYNTAIGQEALRENTTANYNTAVGYQAGYYNTTGLYQTFVGAYAGTATTTGEGNSAFGVQSLEINTTGAYNTAIGRFALKSNTTASNNTAVGYQAGYNNTTGTENSYVGTYAGYTNSTGNYNTALGRAALYSNTGSYNTAVGHNTLSPNSSGNFNTAFGQAALGSNTTASYFTAVGYQAAYNNTTGTGTAIGAGASYSNTTGSDNISVGNAALNQNTTGSYNTAIGRSALEQNTTASNNTAVGYQAGYSNTTGNVNVFVGGLAGYGTTTGVANTMVGYRAGYTNSTGQITALGYAALENSTTASGNTGVGVAALRQNTTGYQNTAVGDSTLQANTTGILNTATGTSAGTNVTTGSFNTYFGRMAGRDNSTGSSNTCVGLNAGLQATGSNNTFIGSNSGDAVTTGAKNTILGVYNGNQGGLDIRTASNYIVLSDGDGNPRFGSNSNNFILFGTNAYISSQNSSLYAYGNLASTSGVYLANNATSWASTSDERRKDIIEPITNALNKVSSLRAVIGKFKVDEEGTRRPFLIAQDVQAVFPEAVQAQVDEDGEFLGMSYTDVVPLLVAAIKELKAENDSLKARLDAANL